MDPLAVLCGAAAGLLAGGMVVTWLTRGAYRRSGDPEGVSLRVVWTVVPATGAAGAVAGTVGWELLPLSWVYLIGGVALVWVDLDVHRIPDRFLAWWAPLVGAGIAAAAVSMRSWGLLGGALLAAGGLAALFLVLALVGSMGLGDVKLAGVTGGMLGTLGWTGVVTGLAATFAAAAVAAAILLARGADRRTHIAFGPAIVVGATVAVLRAGVGF